MRISTERFSNKGSKTFIGLSFRVCNSAEIDSVLLDFVDPEIYLRSRECMILIMSFQTANDFDSENVLIRDEFDNIVLFNFNLLDTFYPMTKLLPA
jgi:hypothetical protein